MIPTRTSRGPNAAPSAKLPGIQASRIDDPATRQAVEALREWVEVRLGARGDPYERAVTKRELLAELDKFRSILSTTSATSTTTVQSATSQTVDLSAIKRQITDLQDAIALASQTSLSGDEQLQAQIDALNKLLSGYSSTIAASSVTVADALGYFAGADVEAVLSEIWAYVTSQVDGPISPDTPPIIPETPNDEFELGADVDMAGARFSGAKPWSWVNQGSASAAVTQGALVIKAPTSATGDLRGVSQPVRGDEWVYRAKLSGLMLTASNVAMVGMFCRNSSTGKIIGAHKSFNTGARLEVSHWSGANTFTSTTTSVDVFSAPWLRSLSDEIYFEIELSGGMLNFRFSDSGVDGTFNQFASEPASGFIGSVDEVGLCCANIANADPVVGAWDWFRQTGSGLLVLSSGAAGPGGSAELAPVVLMQPSGFAGPSGQASLRQQAMVAAVGAAYPSSSSDITLAASIGSTTDPYFSSVLLLLHGDALIGSGLGATTPDSSSYSHVVTCTTGSGVTLDTSVKKFGSGAIRFSSGGDTLSIPGSAEWDFGTSDYTIEMWVRPDVGAISHTQVLFCKSNGTSYYPIQVNIDINGRFFIRAFDPSMNLSQSNPALSPIANNGVWYHVAVSRSNGAIRLFIDGVLIDTIFNTTSYYLSTDPVVLGALSLDYLGANFVGVMDEVRITKGMARYTTTFTPPTAAFSNSPPIDPYFSSVKALLHFEGSSLLDSSAGAHSITANGNSSINAAAAKFGASGGLFDGNGDFASSVSSDYVLGTGDFTVETFVRFSTLSLQAVFAISSLPSVSPYMLLTASTSGSGYYLALSGPDFSVNASTVTLNTSQWYHVAVSRASGVIRLFIDGALVGSGSSTSSLSGTNLSIGGAENVYGGGFFLNGHLDEFRLSVGIARYTATFTPPSEPHPSIGPADPYFGNVALLLHGGGTVGSATITDSSSRSRTPDTTYGTTVSSAQKRFGPTSLACSGIAGTQISLNSGVVDDTLSGDFTAETWVYFNSSISSHVVLMDLQSPSHFMLWTDAVGRLELNLNGSTVASGSTVITPNAWHHVAWTRTAGYHRLFLDGVLEGTSTVTIGSPSTITIGSNAGFFPLDGYLDDVRITNGVSRYVANFAPPVDQFPDKWSDPYISNVSLLMHMDGTGSAFVDSSPLTQKLTAVGSATQSSGSAKYGSAGGAFTIGSGNYVQTSASIDLTGDFTIEGWVKFSSLASDNYFMANGASPYIWFYNSGSTMSAYVGGAAISIPLVTLSAGVWYHFALSRSGTTALLFVNGVGDASNGVRTTGIGLPSAAIFTVGGVPASIAGGAACSLDEVRITKGVARYTANFPPPSLPFPNS